MKLKKYKKKKVSNYLVRELVIIIMALIISFIVIRKMAVRINTALLPIAEEKARREMSIIINNSTKGIKLNDSLFSIEKENNDIKRIEYDSYQATKIINQITDNIQNNFSLLEDTSNQGKVIYEVPIGLIFNNGFLRNVGPKVPVRLDMISDVITELSTGVKPYGINNALIEVRVKVTATTIVALPLTSKEITVSNLIPISINVISGSVPSEGIISYK